MNGGSIDDTWARAADAREAGLPKIGAYPVAGLLRRARRIAGLSQRELARRTGVSPSTVGRIESGAIVPVLPVFARMIAEAGLWLVMVDDEGHIVQPMRDIDDIRNGGGRLYPSHLDTILDPRPGEWWGDQYGLARPPETFHRDPKRREAQRARSVYSVREIWSYGLGDMSAMPAHLRDDPAVEPDDTSATDPNGPSAAARPSADACGARTAAPEPEPHAPSATTPPAAADRNSASAGTPLPAPDPERPSAGAPPRTADANAPSADASAADCNGPSTGTPPAADANRPSAHALAVDPNGPSAAARPAADANRASSAGPPSAASTPESEPSEPPDDAPVRGPFPIGFRRRRKRA